MCVARISQVCESTLLSNWVRRHATVTDYPRFSAIRDSKFKSCFLLVQVVCWKPKDSFRLDTIIRLIKLASCGRIWDQGWINCSHRFESPKAASVCFQGKKLRSRLFWRFDTWVDNLFLTKTCFSIGSDDKTKSKSRLLKWFNCSDTMILSSVNTQKTHTWARCQFRTGVKSFWKNTNFSVEYLSNFVTHFLSLHLGITKEILMSLFPKAYGSN